jgi:hypothetical protein
MKKTTHHKRGGGGKKRPVSQNDEEEEREREGCDNPAYLPSMMEVAVGDATLPSTSPPPLPPPRKHFLIANIYPVFWDLRIHLHYEVGTWIWIRIPVQ